MRKRICVMIILILVSMTVGLPILESGSVMPTDLVCTTSMSNQKTFQANFEDISVGVVCKDTATVKLYSCGETGCFSTVPVDVGYKVRGNLPQFSSFEISHYYYYECFTCRGKDIVPNLVVRDYVKVFEGEMVHLGGRCASFAAEKITVSYSGWMSADAYKTNYQDAGLHEVTVTCMDEFNAKISQQVQVEVVDRNRPPTIMSVRNQPKQLN